MKKWRHGEEASTFDRWSYEFAITSAWRSVQRRKIIEDAPKSVCQVNRFGKPWIISDVEQAWASVQN